MSHRALPIKARRLGHGWQSTTAGTMFQPGAHPTQPVDASARSKREGAFEPHIDRVELR